MALDERKYSYGTDHALRDTRPLGVRLADWFEGSDNAAITFFTLGIATLFPAQGIMFVDIAFVIAILYFLWLRKRKTGLAHKLPAYSNMDSDPNNVGGGRSGKPEGILYLGNRTYRVLV